MATNIFNTLDSNLYEVINDPQYPWVFDDKANLIFSTLKTDNQESLLTIKFLKDCTLKCTFQASSEQGYGIGYYGKNLEYSISGTEQVNITESFSSGETYFFKYQKDESASGNDDCVYISNLEIQGSKQYPKIVSTEALTETIKYIKSKTVTGSVKTNAWDTAEFNQYLSSDAYVQSYLQNFIIYSGDERRYFVFSPALMLAGCLEYHFNLIKFTLEIHPVNNISLYGPDSENIFIDSNYILYYNQDVLFQDTSTNTIYKLQNLYSGGDEISISYEQWNDLNSEDYNINLYRSVSFKDFTLFFDDNSSQYIYKTTECEKPVKFILGTSDAILELYNTSYLYDLNGVQYVESERNIFALKTINEEEDFIIINIEYIDPSDIGLPSSIVEYYQHLSDNFWKRAIRDEQTGQVSYTWYLDYFDIYQNSRDFHFILNQETGIWESRKSGDFLLEKANGAGVFPNRFAFNYLENCNFKLTDESSYFIGKSIDLIEEDDYDYSAWDNSKTVGLIADVGTLIPDIHLPDYPEAQLQSKLKSNTKYINITNTGKLSFNDSNIITYDRLDESSLRGIKTLSSGQIVPYMVSPMLIPVSTTNGIGISIGYYPLVGTINFSFPGYDIDNVKVCFRMLTGYDYDKKQYKLSSIEGFTLYSNISNIKPKIVFKEMPLSIGYMTGDSILSNDYSSTQKIPMVEIKVDLGQTGVEQYSAYQQKFPEEVYKQFQGIAEVNITTISNLWSPQYGIEPASFPSYYNLSYSSEARNYATINQKYLPYMVDKNSVKEINGPIVTFNYRTDSEGNFIPNSSYQEFDNIWTEIPVKQELTL